MTTLTEITRFLDAELRLAEIPDDPHAVNGLQLDSGQQEVTRIACANSGRYACSTPASCAARSIRTAFGPRRRMLRNDRAASGSSRWSRTVAVAASMLLESERLSATLYFSASSSPRTTTAADAPIRGAFRVHNARSLT